MKHICGKMKTKRGNDYVVRASRVATGYSKVLADRKYRGIRDNKPNSKYNTLIRFAVRGTTDILTSNHFILVKSYDKPHPQDSSYTKKVLRLTDKGRIKLKRLQKRRIQNG